MKVLQHHLRWRLLAHSGAETAIDKLATRFSSCAAQSIDRRRISLFRPPLPPTLEHTTDVRHDLLTRPDRNDAHRSDPARSATLVVPVCRQARLKPLPYVRWERNPLLCFLPPPHPLLLSFLFQLFLGVHVFCFIASLEQTQLPICPSPQFTIVLIADNVAVLFLHTVTFFLLLKPSKRLSLLNAYPDHVSLVL